MPILTASNNKIPDDQTGRAVPRGTQALRLSVPPPVLLLAAIVSIQIGAAIATKLFAHLGTTGTVFFRVAFSAVILIALSRPEIGAMALRHWRAVAVYGLTISLMNLAFYHAIARIPLGVAVAIEFLGPLLVGICSSRRPRDLLWLAMAAVGVAIFGRDVGHTLDPLGVLYALLAGVGWAAFIICSQRVGTVMPGNSGLSMALACGALALLPLYLTGGEVHQITWLSIAAALLVAILSTAVPLSLEFAALKRMPARVYSVLVTMEPVIATLVGLVLLAQPLELWTFIAMLLVSGASLGVTIFDR